MTKRFYGAQAPVKPRAQHSGAVHLHFTRQRPNCFPYLSSPSFLHHTTAQRLSTSCTTRDILRATEFTATHAHLPHHITSVHIAIVSKSISRIYPPASAKLTALSAMASNTTIPQFSKTTDAQASSLLFTKLPAELRNEIYKLVHISDTTNDDGTIDLKATSHPPRTSLLPASACMLRATAYSGRLIKTTGVPSL